MSFVKECFLMAVFYTMKTLAKRDKRNYRDLDNLVKEQDESGRV